MKHFRLLATTALFMVLSKPMMAQVKITGVVKDVTGETLIGATVSEKGSKGGTVTDMDGNFALTVNSPASLLCRLQTTSSESR